MDRYFGLLSAACRAADPHHLNLGCRTIGLKSDASADCIHRHGDLISSNFYKRDLAREDTHRLIAETSARLGKPFLPTEWHFGALDDAGLPGVANHSVRTQAERGLAFRRYQETAAAHPCVVGSHYFRWADNPWTGRPDGENYNIGLVDVCARPYPPLAHAVRACHETIYDIASGHRPPTEETPDYLGI